MGFSVYLQLDRKALTSKQGPISMSGLRLGNTLLVVTFLHTVPTCLFSFMPHLLTYTTQNSLCCHPQPHPHPGAGRWCRTNFISCLHIKILRTEGVQLCHPLSVTERTASCRSLLAGEAAFHTLVQVCVDSIYPAGNVTTLQASTNSHLCLIRDSLTSGGLDSIVTYDIIKVGQVPNTFGCMQSLRKRKKIQITPYEESEGSGVLCFLFLVSSDCCATE